MMRYGIVVLAILALTACSTDKGPESKSDQKSQPQSSNKIRISRDSQVTAGIQVATVTRQVHRRTFSASGQLTLNEDRTVHVGTYTDGRVTEIKANQGDYVQKGMVLARLHSHQVHELRASYESAQQEVRRQQDVLDYRMKMRDRMVRLLALKSSSPQEVERAETDLHSAQTDLANARISVTRETVHLSDVLHLPTSGLNGIDEETEKVPIIAAMNGYVIDRRISLGAVVEPGQEMYTISDISSLWMIASVNEVDISKLRVGAAAHLRTQAYPDKTFEGKVNRIGTQLDPQTRTLQVRILLPNARSELRPGMYASAFVETRQTAPDIVITEEAIQDVNGGSVVFVRTDEQTFEPRVVQVGQRASGSAEITAGLHAGEIIATKGSFVVKSELLKSQIGE